MQGLYQAPNKVGSCLLLKAGGREKATATLFSTTAAPWSKPVAKAPQKNFASRTLGDNYAPERELNSQVPLLVAKKRSGQIRLSLPRPWSNSSHATPNSRSSETIHYTCYEEVSSPSHLCLGKPGLSPTQMAIWPPRETRRD